MRPTFYIKFLIAFGLISCGKTNNTTEKVKTKLTFEVVPEDYERNLFTVTWSDTLGQAEGYVDHKWFTRPKEIWCIITNNKKDTLGYYRGLSTAQTYAAFESIDTVVTLNFMMGLNFFSDRFGTGKNMNNFEKNARDYSKINKLPLVFEPLQINLKTDLRKKIEIVLEEK